MTPGTEDQARGDAGSRRAGWRPLSAPGGGPGAGGDPQDAFRASPFTRLAIAHAFSMAGDAMITMALAGSLFFDISPKAARGRVMLSLLFTIAPFAIVAPLLGPIIDKTKGGRRAMVVISMAGRAVCCLLMARVVHGLLLFPAALATLVLSKGYLVAKASLVPAAIDKSEHLVEANSKLAVGGAVVGMLAAIPGVPILQLLGAAALLRIDAIIFIVGAVAALRIVPARKPPPVLAAQQQGPQPPVQATERQARLGTGILLAAGAMGSLRFTVGFMTFLIAFAFRRGHAAPWWYGIVLISSLGGNLLGAAIAPLLRGRLREQWIIAGTLASVAVTGLIASSLSVLHHRPAAALLGLVVGLGAGSAKVAFDALVQQDAPEAIQSRAFARFEAVFQLLWVVGGLAPVVIAMSMSLGFMVVTLLAIGMLISYAVLSLLADRGQLPGWFPKGWVNALSMSPAPVPSPGPAKGP